MQVVHRYITALSSVHTRVRACVRHVRIHVSSVYGWVGVGGLYAKAVIALIEDRLSERKTEIIGSTSADLWVGVTQDASSNRIVFSINS